MALNAGDLSDDIKADILANIPTATTDGGQLQALCDSIADSVVARILSDMDITIEIGDVIVSVTGGSGAPAVGVSNAAPIDCGVA